MGIGLYLKDGDKPVMVGDTLKDKKGVEFTVKRRLDPNFRFGAAAIVDTEGNIRLPSEYGAYCTTED